MGPSADRGLLRPIALNLPPTAGNFLAAICRRQFAVYRGALRLATGLHAHRMPPVENSGKCIASSDRLRQMEATDLEDGHGALSLQRRRDLRHLGGLLREKERENEREGGREEMARETRSERREREEERKRCEGEVEGEGERECKREMERDGKGGKEDFRGGRGRELEIEI
jgi:hypothetical protein